MQPNKKCAQSKAANATVLLWMTSGHHCIIYASCYLPTDKKLAHGLRLFASKYSVLDMNGWREVATLVLVNRITHSLDPLRDFPGFCYLGYIFPRLWRGMFSKVKDSGVAKTAKECKVGCHSDNSLQ